MSPGSDGTGRCRHQSDQKVSVDFGKKIMGKNIYDGYISRYIMDNDNNRWHIPNPQYGWVIPSVIRSGNTSLAALSNELSKKRLLPVPEVKVLVISIYIYINGHFRNQCKGYVRGYTPKIWRYMVQYLHFRILEFPLMIVENHFRLAAWNHHFSGLPDPSCHTCKIWKVLIWGATSSIQWLVGSFKTFATWSTCIIMHLHAIPSNDEPSGLLMKETGD